MEQKDSGVFLQLVSIKINKLVTIPYCPLGECSHFIVEHFALFRADFPMHVSSRWGLDVPLCRHVTELTKQQPLQ